MYADHLNTAYKPINRARDLEIIQPGKDFFKRKGMNEKGPYPVPRTQDDPKGSTGRTVLRKGRKRKT